MTDFVRHASSAIALRRVRRDTNITRASSWSFCFMSLFVFALMLARRAEAVTWGACDAESARVIRAVQLQPDPAERGADTTVTLIGTLPPNVQIRSATINLQIQLGGFTVMSKQLDLCSLTPCPLKNSFIIRNTISGSEIPFFAPAGNYVVVATMVDNETQRRIGCVQLSIDLT